MQGEGTTYAFSVGYTPRGGDHEFNFSLIGAGQWHHQAYYGTELQEHTLIMVLCSRRRL